MLKAFDLAEFAEKNGWIVIERNEENDEELDDDFIRYLTPAGRRVIIGFNKDGSISTVYP